MPRRPDGVGSEAGGITSLVELTAPPDIRCATVHTSSHKRSDSPHLSHQLTCMTGDAVEDRGPLASIYSGGILQAGRDWESHQSSLFTLMDPSTAGTAAAGVSPPDMLLASPQAADLVTGTSMHSSIPIPNHSTVVIDTQSIQLLQELQQLLQSGVSTAALQQWVSRQLLQATSGVTSTSSTAAVVASTPSARPLAATTLSGAVPGQPVSPPPIPIGSRPLRRPVPAVSFSLSTDSHPHAQQQQSETQERPTNDGKALPHPVSITSAIESVCTANTSSPSSMVTSAGDGSAASLVPVIGRPTPLVVAAQLEADLRAPLHTVSQPFSTGLAATASLERGLCPSVDDPLAISGSADVDPAPTQRGACGGLLKASRPLVQHPPWRSFRSKGHNAGSSSSAPPPGGARLAAVPGIGANPLSPTTAAFPPPGSPVDTPTKCHIASALHSVTKAVIHATTSQLMTEDQQSIALLIGERFSRHPQSYVRCGGATPLPLGSGGPPGTPASAGATSGAAPFQGRSCGVSNNVSAGGDGNSGVAAEATALEQLSALAPSLDVPKTRSPSVASAPRNMPESAAVPVVVYPVHHVPLISTNTVSCRSGSARDMVSRHSPAPAAALSISASSMETTGDEASGVSARQDHYGVAKDYDAMSTASCDSSDAVLATRPLSCAETDSSPHQRHTHGGSPEQPTESDAEAERKLLLHRRRHSSSLSAVVAARFPAAAAEGPAGDAAELAAAADGSGVVCLIELHTEDASASCTPARGSSPPNTSSISSSSDCHELPRSWGDTANQAGERHHHHPHRAPTTTLPPVSTISAPYALAQPSLNAVSPAATLANSLSQYLMSPSVAPHRGRPASVPPRRTTSFASTTSSHLGSGGAAVGTGFSALLNLAGRSGFSYDEIPNVECSRTAGVSPSVGDHVVGKCRRRSSALHLNRSLVNGGDGHTEGVMASFVLDEINGAQHRSGPRFLRSFCRHTPVRVTESVTHEALDGLGVPFFEGIDSASVPTNVFRLMDTYGFMDSCAFYVAVCLNVCLRYEFVQRFGWNLQKLKRFFEVAATYFCEGNPFHNPVHAVDVVMAAHQWLNEGSTGAALSDDEAMTFLFTAMVQQLAHTGADNRLLAHLKHPYAMLCSYASPQQGATVALLMALLSRPELHFFPDPLLVTSGSTSVVGGAEPTVVHEWTTNRELQMYDMLADLIMATDERNHVILKQGIVHMGEENARRHGCLCSSTRLSRLVAQSDTAMRMQYPSQQGNFCLNCCAYITDAHVPDVLKAVLLFIDYAYLFRPYQVYRVQNVAYIAELYRQSEREYKLLQALQQGQLQKAMADKADEGGLGETASPHLSGVGRRGTTFSVPATDAYTFATAFLSEQQPWRQGVAQVSTMTSLQRSNEEGMIGLSTPPKSRRGTDVAQSSEKKTHSNPVRQLQLELDERLEPPLANASRGEGMASSNIPGSAKRAQLLKGFGRDIVLICIEDLCLPFLEQLSPYMPEAWVAACYRNHQLLMKSLPTPEEFDEVVNRFLDMGEMTEAERMEEDIKKEGEFEDGDSDSRVAERPFTLPWRLLRPLRPVAAEWTASKDTLVRRVLQEIMKGSEKLLKKSDEP
ncbi:hypothetical protein JKF63_05484 [Porcisia hertigi]|uniref:PDEase domain-containing protein n=1 Tax=Porcisia hertigi TaxID=2761500 RepID=A0A836IYI2_9TRYP|nr:hypothetical protein JKF63_05484 [Porcisia hertigi]